MRITYIGGFRKYFMYFEASYLVTSMQIRVAVSADWQKKDMKGKLVCWLYKNDEEQGMRQIRRKERICKGSVLAFWCVIKS